MSEDRQSNLTSPDLWIRLVYMLVFWLLSWLARAAIAVIAVVQFVLVLINGEGNSNLRSFGQSTAAWIQQNFLFLCFASEEKPFPFQDWPQCADEGDDNQPSSTASTSADTEAAEKTAGAPQSSQQSETQAGNAGQTDPKSTEDNGTKSSFGNTREP